MRSKRPESATSPTLLSAIVYELFETVDAFGGKYRKCVCGIATSFDVTLVLWRSGYTITSSMTIAHSFANFIRQLFHPTPADSSAPSYPQFPPSQISLCPAHAPHSHFFADPTSRPAPFDKHSLSSDHFRKLHDAPVCSPDSDCSADSTASDLH